MSTQQALIEDAYASIGILDEETGVEPAMLQRGLRELHKLVNRLYDDGISMPYYLSDNLSDDTNVTAASEEALEANLALKLSSAYANDRQPSMTLVNTAKNSTRVLRNRKSSKPVRVHPRTLPRGTSGRWATNTNYPTFYSNTGSLRVIASNNDPMFANGSPLYTTSETWT